MTDKKRKSGSELVKSLHDLICDDDIDKVETMPLEEVYSYLKKNNIVHDQVIADVQNRLNKMKAKAGLDEAKEKRADLLDKLNNSALPVLTDLKGSIKTLIDNMMAVNPQMASAYYNKFESSTKNDLKSLYHDLLTLQQLNKTDADKQS